MYRSALSFALLTACIDFSPTALQQSTGPDKSIDIDAVCRFDTDCQAREVCDQGRCVYHGPSALTLVATPEAGLVADGVAASSVAVTVTNDLAEPSFGETVRLAVSGTGNGLAPASAVTDDNGRATFSLTSTVAESKTLSVVLGEGISELTLASNATVAFVAGPPGAGTMASVLPQSVKADGAATATISVECRDNNGNICAGVPLSLSSDNVFDTIAEANGTTSASGTFATTIRSTNAGAHTVTVTLGALSLPLAVTFEPGTPAVLRVLAEPTSGLTETPLAETRVQLEDSNGNITTASGVLVSLALSGGAGTLGGTTTVASSSGLATFSDARITRAGTAYVLTAQASGLVSDATAAFPVVAWRDITGRPDPVFGSYERMAQNAAGTIIYLASRKQVFRSGDSGATFEPRSTGLVFSPPDDICALGLDPTNADIVYAGTDNGIYKTTNGGGIWARVDTFNHDGACALSFGGNRLFVGLSGVLAADRGAHYSDDGGVTWNPGSSPINTATVYAIAAASPDRAYAATNSGMMRTDDGTEWFSANTGLVDNHTLLAVHPTNPEIVYTGSGGQVFKTINGGEDWTDMTGDVGYQGNRLWTTSSAVWHASAGDALYRAPHDSSAFSPVAAAGLLGDSGKDVWVSSDESRIDLLTRQLQRSTDTGATFSNVGTALVGSPHKILIDHTASRHFVYVHGSDLVASTNGDGQWRSVSFGAVGFDDTTFDGARVVGVTSGGDVYAGEADVPFELTTAQPGVGLSAVAWHDTNRWMIAGATYIATSIGGASWPGFSFAPTGNITWLLPKPGFTSTVVLAATASGVFRTANGGSSTWGVAVIPIASVLSASWSRSDSAIVWVAARGSGIYRSANDGANWSAVNAGLPASGNMLSVAASPSNTAIAYGGTTAQGVYKTTNGGTNWTAANSGMPAVDVHYIAIDPFDEKAVYAIAGPSSTSGLRIYKTLSGGE